MRLCWALLASLAQALCALSQAMTARRNPPAASSDRLSSLLPSLAYARSSIRRQPSPPLLLLTLFEAMPSTQVRPLTLYECVSYHSSIDPSSLGLHSLKYVDHPPSRPNKRNGSKADTTSVSLIMESRMLKAKVWRLDRSSSPCQSLHHPFQPLPDSMQDVSPIPYPHLLPLCEDV